MNHAQSVLLVLSFKKRNLELLTQVLEQANYQVTATCNYSELANALSNQTHINLGLIDLSGCDRHIWDYCTQLKTKNIPFLIFSPKYNALVEQNSLAYGASSVLVKPLVIKNLLSLIKNLLIKPA